ncbi:hypothetical protein ABZ543_34740 [Streptomyces roseifaciens]
MAEDMHASGVPLLGWITPPSGLRPYGAVPSQADLEDTSIVSGHTPVARQILNVLPGIRRPLASWETAR